MVGTAGSVLIREVSFIQSALYREVPPYFTALLIFSTLIFCVGSQSGNVTILPQEVSMATREYCLKYGLLDEKSRQPVSNVLDITRLRGLPKLL